jgi:hypothetical protein
MVWGLLSLSLSFSSLQSLSLLARDRVASGELKFGYCKSKENVSDCLTKELPRALLEMGLRGLGML